MWNIFYITIIIVFIITLNIKRAEAWIIYGTIPNIPAARSVLDATFSKFFWQPKLVKGMTNASAFSSQVGTQRGFQDYDKFSITIATMGAAQVPSHMKSEYTEPYYSYYYTDYYVYSTYNPGGKSRTRSENLSEYKRLNKILTRRGDSRIGVAWNPWSACVGVALPKNFYISGKFGYLKFNYDDYDFDSMHAGGMINWTTGTKYRDSYKKFNRSFGALFSIGAGFLWQHDNTVINHKEFPLLMNGYLANTVIKINAKINSYIIPIDISITSFIWIININLGFGIDFAFGSSFLRYSSSGIVIGSSNAGLTYAYGKQPGHGPDRYRFKIFCSPGLRLGPIIIDIPFTYYFLGGFNFGATVGIAI
jgi:hypothetical protein